MALGKSKFGDKYKPSVTLRSREHGRMAWGENWKVQCFRKGELLWEDGIANLIPNSGLRYALGCSLANAAADANTAQIVSWYVGLLVTGFSAIAAGTSLAGIASAGNDEFGAYTATNRQLFVPAALSGQTVDNSASKASFTINAATACGGAFLTSIQVRSALTSAGVAATLFAAGAFTGGDRTGLQNNDELQITAEFSAADDGV